MRQTDSEREEDEEEEREEEEALCRKSSGTPCTDPSLVSCPPQGPSLLFFLFFYEKKKKNGVCGFSVQSSSMKRKLLTKHIFKRGRKGSHACLRPYGQIYGHI